MKGDERRSLERWDGGHSLRAATISRLESDQSAGTNTHTHIYSNRASSAALIRADMPFILLLLEYTPRRRQVNKISGYHTVLDRHQFAGTKTFAPALA